MIDLWDGTKTFSAGELYDALAWFVGREGRNVPVIYVENGVFAPLVLLARGRMINDDTGAELDYLGIVSAGAIATETTEVLAVQRVELPPQDLPGATNE